MMQPDIEAKIWSILADDMGIPVECTDIRRFSIPERDLFPDEIEVLMTHIAMCEPTSEGHKHILADDLLVRLLKQLRYDAICSAYESVGKRFS